MFPTWGIKGTKAQWLKQCRGLGESGGEPRMSGQGVIEKKVGAWSGKIGADQDDSTLGRKRQI